MEKKNSSNRPWKAGFGGIAKLICMSKIRNFAEIAPTIGFSDFDFDDLYRSTFENSELGRMALMFLKMYTALKGDSGTSGTRLPRPSIWVMARRSRISTVRLMSLSRCVSIRFIVAMETPERPASSC